ncbi:PREDICTED: dirigent protein 24-like [Nicotiana attenuata]|uniref:Dirigent protein n=1 Tax=Nicotiana attenuata TaxID=49451 RepID=A0A314L712_NICAT|nr:PREDICTED: dirigent protein 24-like [Nicotiana attenuata]OIT36887.1 dirigent protein 9 [Nicotiana attenuata]
MVKFSQLCSKTFQFTFCILLLTLSFGIATSARILDEVSSDEPVVAPVVAPTTTLPSGHFPAAVTAPDSNPEPIEDDDSSIPANTVAPSPDFPTEPEPDTAPVVSPAAPEAPVADATTNTGAAPPVTNVAPEVAATSDATVANPIPGGHSTFSFFMHDILGGTHPSGRVVTGIVANTDANNLPFSKANNQVFPIDGGVPLNNINNIVNNNNYPFLVGLNGQQQSNTVLQNTGNNNIVDSGDNQPFVTAGQLPTGLSLQQLMFGSITVVDNEITEGHELGSAILGRTQGFYLTSSSDGTSHTLALTTLFHGQHEHEVEDTISFFGIHRTATPISHIAIIGGTGKYENAKGYATIETLPHVDQHTTDGVETITHFTVYITP